MAVTRESSVCCLLARCDPDDADVRGGLRFLECLCLRVQVIDSSRKEILVRDGKGAKERITMLTRYFIRIRIRCRHIPGQGGRQCDFSRLAILLRSENGGLYGMVPKIRILYGFV